MSIIPNDVFYRIVMNGTVYNRFGPVVYVFNGQSEFDTPEAARAARKTLQGGYLGDSPIWLIRPYRRDNLGRIRLIMKGENGRSRLFVPLKIRYYG